MDSLTRFGVIGDIHAEDRALERVLGLFAEEGVERVLAVGDLVDGPGDANRCIQMLRDRNIPCVRGNHDRWLLEDDLRNLPAATPRAALHESSLEFLETLPLTLELSTPDGLLLLCHGLGDDDMNGVRPYDDGYAIDSNQRLIDLLVKGRYRYIVNGHTHRRMVRTFAEDGVTIINAGTLLRGREPCVGIVDLQAHTVVFYDVDAVTITPSETHTL